MDMWQQLLDRFVPLMEGESSALDQRDGVGASTGLVAHVHVDAARAAGLSRSAFEGSVRPLTS